MHLVRRGIPKTTSKPPEVKKRQERIALWFQRGSTALSTHLDFRL